MPRYPLIIDTYSHITPQRYIKALRDSGLDTPHLDRPALYDLDERFRIMDKYEGLVQVLSVGLPPVSTIKDKAKALEVAKTANDEMAELVTKYPDRFVGAVAAVPMTDMDDALGEIDRAITELKLNGVEVPTPVNDKPLDAEEFMPLYEKMQDYNLPVYLHPDRYSDYPDYRAEDRSKYFIYTLWGWPYETTTAMTRLVCSGVLEKFPELKVLTHHCGAMVPYFKERIINFYDLFQTRAGLDLPLRDSPIEYFKKFYMDTALYGNPSALMCAYDFVGADRLVFGADMPLGDSQMGYRNYRQTLNAIDEMPVSEAEKQQILQGNARRMLRLPV
ncbi:MAG: amidohydrolase family protein [Desulfobacteraceae bacterium]|nr:amidohydrolase family protein [Desulfobacteraceae bacterium]